VIGIIATGIARE